MKKTIITLTILSLQACSFGEYKYSCTAGSEDGVCASADTIYQVTNGELKDEESVTFFEDGKKRVVSLKDLNQVNANKSESLKKEDSFSSGAVDSITYDGAAVRAKPSVMRIWIAPWVSQDDSLSMSKHVYIDMQEKQWKFGSKEEEQSRKSVYRSKPKVEVAGRSSK